MSCLKEKPKSRNFTTIEENFSGISIRTTKDNDIAKHQEY